jgi:hypothetical protein
MLETDAGIARLLRLEHPSNALEAIDSMLLGKYTLVRLVFLLKAFALISLMLTGIVSDRKRQPANALLPIVTTLGGIAIAASA